MKEIHCSFCELRNDYLEILTGPCVNICDKCTIQILSLMINHPIRAESSPLKSEQEKPAHCAFCGKCQDEVKCLVVKNGSVSICNECMVLCIEEFLPKSNPVVPIPFQLGAYSMMGTQNVAL